MKFKNKNQSKIIFLCSIILFGVFGWAEDSQAETIWNVVNLSGQPSCEQIDVQRMINDKASSGDTVMVPAGECTWTTQTSCGAYATTSGLCIEKGIILRGAGIDTTIINTNGSVSYLIWVEPSTPENNPHVEVTGFTFNGNNISGNHLRIQNENINYDFDNFRIHHNKFQNTYNSTNKPSSIYTRGMVFGLIDNNEFYNNYYNINTRGYDTNSWNKYVKDTGNTLLYSSLDMGGSRFLFVENNTIGGSANFFMISGEGSRWVSRYNNIDGGDMSALFDIHGDTRNDGNVAVEIYENNETTAGDDMGLTFADYRGGTSMIFNNVDRVYSSGLRTSIKVREETSPCGELWKGYDMKIHNGYIWNNRNVYADPAQRIQISHHDHAGSDYDPLNCLTAQVDYWSDTQDDTNIATDYFASDIASNRPVTCADDDCYWETDTRKLYRCDGDNNWTFIYTPYTYPHPLRNENPIDPIPPSNPTGLSVR